MVPSAPSSQVLETVRFRLYGSMGTGIRAIPTVAGRVAFWTLGLFLLAVLAAFAVTLIYVPIAVKLLAAAAGVPIIAVTGLLLYLERTDRAWSYLAAAMLGGIGVTLRLVVDAHPTLEVGGGLPISVTVAYLGLGVAVVATSLWSYAHPTVHPAVVDHD